MRVKNSDYYCDANLVMNRPGEHLFAKEVCHADRSERKHAVAKSDEATA
ncbi:hypothetical protein MFUM_700137 [Methylacidiphilum fumariolicum SolV]|uniref:Uncharacterized protein n=2 Tax=Candidatus Methylacidiphilum fumarolicum TaxID=591154 RepID=I0JZB4_METFB|nr:conserved protein of unknown function [Candidatus Methylacidiphilum fumarolicum]CCG92583.1 hypothetical protein MFUM_700137 [Methylacidiphilum fumariolicum SolV]